MSGVDSMKVCIVGASGKLGRYMVQHALDRGYQVVGVCRERSVGKLDAFKQRITVIPGATNDREVIKQAVAGHGGADKGQVQRMVKALLGLPVIPKPDDTADALAAAITHAQCSRTALSQAVKKLSQKSPLPPSGAWRGARVLKSF